MRPPRRAPSARRRGAFRCNEPQKMCTKPTCADAPATNLKKCAAGCAAAQAPPSAREWGLRAEGAGRRRRRARAQPAGVRRRRALADRSRRAEVASAESGFVHVLFGLLRDCGAVRPPSGHAGRLRRFPFYKLVRHPSSDLRFCSGKPEAGRHRRARLRNRPKKCATGCAAAPTCGSRTSGRPQVVASRSPRPAARNLHQSPQGRGGRGPSVRRSTARPRPARPGDLWRFRKANPLVDGP